jgi:putative addiction module killer protein
MMFGKPVAAAPDPRFRGGDKRSGHIRRPEDYGPGYRVYFCRRGEDMILLLCGGDKSTQDRDIREAKAMAKEIER